MDASGRTAMAAAAAQVTRTQPCPMSAGREHFQRDPGIPTKPDREPHSTRSRRAGNRRRFACASVLNAPGATRTPGQQFRKLSTTTWWRNTTIQSETQEIHIP